MSKNYHQKDAADLGLTYLVRADVARIPSLGYDPRIGPYGTISIDLMAAIRLVIVPALLAIQAGVDLSADTDSGTRFDQGDSGPNADGFADDLVTAAKGPVLGSPSPRQGVDVRAADAAGLDLDVDVEVFKWFGGELRRGMRIWSGDWSVGKGARLCSPLA